MKARESPKHGNPQNKGIIKKESMNTRNHENKEIIRAGNQQKQEIINKNDQNCVMTLHANESWYFFTCNKWQLYLATVFVSRIYT